MTEAANLIFFTGENHCREVAGCYGHPLARTPTLDRLAARGTLFENAYCASPLCCPARASIATGRYPHETGYWENSTAYNDKVPSWMHRLRDAGHEVAAVGKLHYRATEDDNGFSEEIVPMHILDGIGGLPTLLRWSGEQPEMSGQWDLYWSNSGVGETEYQAYDREITRQTIQWLEKNAANQAQPFTLLVSYVSSHPPFLVPKELYELYTHDRIPLPVGFQDDKMPRHPALEHLRRLKQYRRMDDEAVLKTVSAGYFGLITHLDRQIGAVMAAAERLGLLDNTRLAYTSDHGESYGHHGIFGKNHLLEPAVRVPLLMSGPGIPSGKVVQQCVSAVDVFHTLGESAGIPAEPADTTMPGHSLWPAMTGPEQARTVFAEFHASASKNGGFLWRNGADKLIYHVDMPNQLFNLERDPMEMDDLVVRGAGAEREAALEAELRGLCDPEAVDRNAKADQHRWADKYGGNEAIKAKKTFAYTPPPGHEPRFM